MRFTKMHGLGNDYVYVDCFKERVSDPAALSRIISDRHIGVGSDGLILICPSTAADVRMEMYNADGSRGEMCGNGVRCVGKYAYEHGLVRREPRGGAVGMTVESDAGIVGLELRLAGRRVDTVRVDMGQPRWSPESIPVSLRGEQVIDHPYHVAGCALEMTCVSMGNPHAVFFTDDVDAAPLAEWGPAIERDPLFPKRVNVHFAQALSRDHVRMRTWERGSGITRACGSGACAVGVAGALTGRTDRSIRADLPGGSLVIEWAPGGSVLMTGPAAEVFAGEWPDGAT